MTLAVSVRLTLQLARPALSICFTLSLFLLRQDLLYPKLAWNILELLVLLLLHPECWHHRHMPMPGLWVLGMEPGPSCALG